jgi:ABC-2 type transport system ATP-binding protein
MSALLATMALTKTYGPHTALHDLHLQVQPGEIVGLLGPNGAGKSTALRLILGFLRPTRGTATLAGFDCWRQGVAARQQVSYLPGELRLYENYTGRQLLAFLGKLRGAPPTPQRTAELADWFDIDLDVPLVNLSSGMKRKIALIAVLAPAVPLVILDEPTNTLDPNMRAAFLTALRHARTAGQAILFSSHVLSEVEAVCDRVAILRRGHLVHEQRVADLHEQRRVQVRFAKVPTSWPTWPGTHIGTPTTDGSVTLEHTGNPTELLAWLGTQAVQDVRIEPMGLTAVYQRFHEIETP